MGEEKQFYPTKPLQIEFRDPNELEVAETNVRYIIPPDEILEPLVESVRTTGILEPIILNQEGKIVSGQLRWTAAKRAGLKRVPCIRIYFPDKFSEMLCCMAQDYIRHNLTDEERYRFVCRARQMGYSVRDIARALGVAESTIWNWIGKFERVAPQIRGTEAEQKLYSLPTKKKLTVDRALRDSTLVRDLEKSVQLVEFASKAPLRDIEQVTRDIKSGLNVDLKKREQVIKEENELWEIRVPKKLAETFRRVLKLTKRDFLATILELLEEFVKENADVLLQAE